MTAKVTFVTELTSIPELEHMLSENIEQDAPIDLQRQQKPLLFRGGENEILLAIISSLSLGLGALITGILKVVVQLKANKIMIKSKSGATIEVPSDFDLKKIGELVEEIKKLDEKNIDLIIE